MNGVLCFKYKLSYTLNSAASWLHCPASQKTILHFYFQKHPARVVVYSLFSKALSMSTGTESLLQFLSTLLWLLSLLVERPVTDPFEEECTAVNEILEN